jgi:hypothetical protein
LSKKKCEQQGNDDIEVCVWNMNNQKNLPKNLFRFKKSQP